MFFKPPFSYVLSGNYSMRQYEARGPCHAYTNRRSSRALELIVTVLTAVVIHNTLLYKIPCDEFDFIFSSEVLVDQR